MVIKRGRKISLKESDPGPRHSTSSTRYSGKKTNWTSYSHQPQDDIKYYNHPKVSKIFSALPLMISHKLTLSNTVSSACTPVKMYLLALFSLLWLILLKNHHIRHIIIRYLLSIVHGYYEIDLSLTPSRF